MDLTSGFSVFSDEHYMRQALNEAQRAYEEGEVPIGAVVVSKNRIIGRGYNQVERLQDATAHAEMIAITAASEYLGNKYLNDCLLYVTIEPCLMCSGALRWVQLKKLVYGSSEPKVGYSLYDPSPLHPKTEVIHGILADECRQLMASFFQERRNS